MEEQKLYYQDPYSLLVISPSGLIKKLFTPFPVICRIDVLHLITGEVVMVSSIDEEQTEKGRMIIFVIDDHRVYHRYFEIP